MTHAKVLIALGANLPSRAGSPAVTLAAALSDIVARAGNILRCSGLYESPAWPDPSDPPFVNLVALIETLHAPDALLANFKVLEASFGRQDSARNAPRPLDIDILDYAGRVEHSAALTLPHPRLAERAFVLVPLTEILPDWIHPVSGQRADQLLWRLPEAERQAVRPVGAEKS